MKTKSKLAFLAVVLYGLMARAGALDSVVIDENGNGTWYDSVNERTVTFTGSFTDDPSQSGLSALVYTTPFDFSVTGDYEIYTPGTDELAGVVRFWIDEDTGANYMIFYDNDVGTEQSMSLADRSGIPVGRLAFTLGLDQTLVGDPSSTIVDLDNPTDAGMAGFAGIDRRYTFLSVIPVPEPGALALLACGTVLLALRRRPAGS